MQALVAELVEAESVPLLPILNYKPSGLRKRAEWERTWELQREEDNLERQLDARRKIIQREEQNKRRGMFAGTVYPVVPLRDSSFVF